MTEATLDIKKWGNSLGVRIPAEVAREAHFHLDQRIQITVENDTIVLKPIKRTTTSLKDRLERFDPAKHGGEVIQSQLIGAEK